VKGRETRFLPIEISGYATEQHCSSRWFHCVTVKRRCMLTTHAAFPNSVADSTAYRRSPVLVSLSVAHTLSL